MWSDINSWNVLLHHDSLFVSGNLRFEFNDPSSRVFFAISGSSIQCPLSSNSGSKNTKTGMDRYNSTYLYSSINSWQDFIRDMQWRGLPVPILVATDGAPGLTLALDLPPLFGPLSKLDSAAPKGYQLRSKLKKQVAYSLMNCADRHDCILLSKS